MNNVLLELGADSESENDWHSKLLLVSPNLGCALIDSCL